MHRTSYCLVISLLLLILVGCSTSLSHGQQPGAGHVVREVRVIRPQVKTGEATLYIGMAGQFAAYPFPYQGEVTPDQLIAAIGDLTGWDLHLDAPVLRDKSGITVTFAQDCALFTGPPEPQKEDFFVYSAEELCTIVLDSVCHTLQWNSVNPKLTDPGLVPIYFRTADGDLSLEAASFTQPEDLPYGGLIPGAQVTSTRGRFLRMLPSQQAVFDLDGQEVTMSLYSEDVAYTLSQVTPGLEVGIVSLRSGTDIVLTMVY